ncbi:MAG: oxygen-independent coproporphyrinogen-3 oxidase, partial [Gammaproteobacteria bacterium]
MGQVTNIRLDPQTDQAPIRAQTLSPKEGTPLYVHLPYCVAKCTYCDFFSVAAEGEDLDGTLAGILREALHRAPKKPRTVFLGGGTPSLYSTSELTTLLDGLDRVTGFRNSATEVTLECNPESLDEEKARALIDLGVNRLSIGVQSLRPEILKLFGRVHDAETAIAAYHSARRAGVPQVSLDVIYAAPGQDLGTWMSDLETLLALAPDHISAYHLAYEPGTLMEKWEREGGVQRQGEETELAFFTNTRARLAEAGMPGYELSN